MTDPVFDTWIWIAAGAYVLWCIAYGTVEELQCRRLSATHSGRDWLGYPLMLVGAPLLLLSGHGWIGGKRPDDYTTGETALAFHPAVKWPLAIMSVPLMLWSLSLFFNWHQVVFIAAFLALHESGHALTAVRLGVRVTGFGGVPFLGAFVSHEPVDDSAMLGRIALGGIVGGLLLVPVALAVGPFVHEAWWAAGAALNVSAFNMIPFGPFDGSKVYAWHAHQNWHPFPKLGWLSACMAIWFLPIG